jgi:hypothetical protein
MPKKKRKTDRPVHLKRVSQRILERSIKETTKHDMSFRYEVRVRNLIRQAIAYKISRYRSK